jgi:hypothetical protein
MERDKSMRAAMEVESSVDGETVMENPRLSADKIRNLAAFEYDADLEVDKWWSERGEKELAQLAHSTLDA